VFKSFDAGGMPIEGLIAREWLAANGIGGFASSTVPCCNTRKYHGLLVAAMAAPVRRMVLLSRMEETVHCDGWPHALSTNEYPGKFHPEGYRALRAFSPEPFPRWAFQGENWTLQKELCLLREQNTVVLTYTLLAGQRPVSLELRPLFALRPIHELGLQWNGKLVTETRAGGTSHHIPATTRTPEVFFAHTGSFEPEPHWYLNTIYRREQERGYAGLEDVWSPGGVRFTLKAGQSAHFVCSADPFELDVALEQVHAYGATTSKCGALESVYVAPSPSPAAQDDRTLADLSYAASQFLVHSSAATASSPDAIPSAVIGGYPWSPPSGRAALAGFAGLFLVTGRHDEGRSLLLSMAAKLDRGLMPSDFQENGSAPLYLGADVALWFANAVYAYLRYTRDEATVGGPLYDTLLRIIEQYRRGTRLGISVDETGLLRTHAPAAATTWMDAKVGDWVITPRQGRPVEINALWYNAVSIAAELATRFGRTTTADDLFALSRLIRIAFNDRFWHAAAGCCHDVVSDRGPDPAIRPNQLLAARPRLRRPIRRQRRRPRPRRPRRVRLPVAPRPPRHRLRARPRPRRHRPPRSFRHPPRLHRPPPGRRPRPTPRALRRRRPAQLRWGNRIRIVDRRSPPGLLRRRPRPGAGASDDFSFTPNSDSAIQRADTVCTARLIARLVRCALALAIIGLQRRAPGGAARMTIILPAEIELRLKNEASRQGLDPSQLAAALLSRALGRSDQATLDVLARWEAENATDDPAEIARREQELQEFKRAMNRNRRDSDGPGARTPFP
jgi:predicted glycogen debranching enzyme